MGHSFVLAQIIVTNLTEASKAAMFLSLRYLRLHFINFCMIKFELGRLYQRLLRTVLLGLLLLSLKVLQAGREEHIASVCLFHSSGRYHDPEECHGH